MYVSGLECLQTNFTKVELLGQKVFLVNCANSSSRVVDSFQGVCMLSHFSCVQLFATLWAITLQAPLSIGFSRQEYLSEFPCPPPGDLPDSTSLKSLVLAGGLFATSTTWEALYKLYRGSISTQIGQQDRSSNFWIWSQTGRWHWNYFVNYQSMYFAPLFLLNCWTLVYISKSSFCNWEMVTYLWHWLADIFPRLSFVSWLCLWLYFAKKF